jgi:Uma2 family endonuclease
VSTLSLERTHTPEELLNGLKSRFELLNGQLVAKPMSAQAGQVAANAITRIGGYLLEHDTGKLFTAECGYQIFAFDPNRVRFADASYIRWGRLPDDRTPAGHVRVPPDWALEVVSPTNIAEELKQKIEEYQRAGVGLLWVAYPLARSVYVYRADRSVARLTGADELSGEDVFPGFTCRVQYLFANLDRKQPTSPPPNTHP